MNRAGNWVHILPCTWRMSTVICTLVWKAIPWGPRVHFSPLQALGDGPALTFVNCRLCYLQFVLLHDLQEPTQDDDTHRNFNDCRNTIMCTTKLLCYGFTRFRIGWTWAIIVSRDSWLIDAWIWTYWKLQTGMIEKNWQHIR